MKLGIALSMTAHAATPVEAARILEQRGFESLFVPDDLDTHTPDEPFAALARAAAATERLIVGTVMTRRVRRDPVQLAEQLDALDRVCGGRMALGRGPGWMRIGDGLQPRDHADHIARLRYRAAELGRDRVHITFYQFGLPTPEILDQCDDLGIDRHVSNLGALPLGLLERTLDELARI
ncbi:LLM class flavin-dependent oxidoreductase [Nocardia sp. NPDC052001]|uniref:LLM class flavin-dependent oxidoreductase n=1 Tax=Nocardia sp. NPDC052001 TaxID=3154853 RepID=UPI003418DDCC